MAESAVCTADVLAAAHRKLGGQVPCQDLCAIWAAVGAEIAQQLLKRRGILLRDLGAVVVTARGVSLLAAAAAPRGGTPDCARPATMLCFAGVSAAAKDLGVRVSRETVAKCVAAVVGELLRCAERKQRTSLALRPVGLFEVAGRAGAGGVSLIVDAAFAEGVARAWDSNLAARPRDYSSQRTGFRPDDREHAATSRQAAAPPRYDAVAGKRQASPATLRNGAGAAALRAKLVARSAPRPRGPPCARPKRL
ncbi:hypothetical protein M885DRAFT_216631 [Pelagophyceae sp. CCMP2097]|nr:hypothetical protein M885DRAFT_216631 [Pelagophyceae sp. CCMP2097]